MFDLSECKNIYMIGIGGISMSSIAEYLYLKGFKIQLTCDRVFRVWL